MKSNWVRLSLALLVGSILAGPVAAQDLEAPAVSPIQSKPGSVRLMVTAGNSGAPAGFYIDRMNLDEYNAYGGWDATNATTWVSGSFVGVPSFNTVGTSPDYTLGAGQSIEVELGQLFDETGVIATDTNELAPATQYVIRIRANSGAGLNASGFTDNLVVSSAGLAQNCTYTIGYWKTHPEVWPVTSLTLGTVNYSAAQLLAILNQPAGGNKLVILAHQLIAAKMNIANGADPSAAAATIAASDALIGSLVVPPIGGDSLPSSPATGYANLLDDYNNGLIGPGHCGTTPATSRTWGSVKAMYRN